MCECSGSAGFVVEALFLNWVARKVVRKKLQRDVTVKGSIVSFVDDAHAALTELLKYLVMGNGLADHGSLSLVANISRSNVFVCFHFTAIASSFVNRFFASI
jgi:hypothetical protein